MTEINPKTGNSIIDTDIRMSLYSFLTNFKMLFIFLQFELFRFQEIRFVANHTVRLSYSISG